MEKIQEKALESDVSKDVDAGSLGRQMIERIQKAVAKGDYKVAFRLFRKNIAKILCGEGILEIGSPYYFTNGKIKEDKVAGEIIGAYQYYCATNCGFRSFRPHGESFRCGKPTASFLAAVKEFLRLLADEPGQDPWEIFCCYMDSSYFDLENYLDRAAVYSFPHNRRSREVTKMALEPYAKKYYGLMDVGAFVELYQCLDRIYTTYGFPFSCTYAGWFFEGYDDLYQKVLDEGAWLLRDFWQQGVPSDWLQKQIEPYDIQSTYEALIEALQKPEYEPLLFRLFPFRLTEDTLRVGCGMETDQWEVFTLKVAKLLYFAEYHNGRKNIQEDMVQDVIKEMAEVLETIRYYADEEKM